MLKLGLIGTDSTHADNFAKMTNPDTGMFKNARFTHVFGAEAEKTQLVADIGAIDNIVASPDEMLDKVDGIMIVFRHGNLHYKHAAPFIKAGVPVWVDKPFTTDNAEARAMLDLAKKHKTLISGGSTLKYSSGIKLLKEKYAAGYFGDIISSVMDYSIFLDSPYGGIHFYAAHLIEMCCEVFGFNIRSVCGEEKNGNLLVRACYDDFDVILNYTRYTVEHFAVVIGSEHGMCTPIGTVETSYESIGEFFKLLETGIQPLDTENLYKTTVITNAIEQSYKTNKTVNIEY